MICNKRINYIFGVYKLLISEYIQVSGNFTETTAKKGTDKIFDQINEL
jgi:hypothetical protein